MDLSIIIDVFSVVAVVSGLYFAGLELRQFRIARKRESALELFNTMISKELMIGARIIGLLPDDQSNQQVVEIVGEGMDDLYYTLATLEGLGVLVRRGELSMELVEDFFSGIIVMTWSKLRRFMLDERKALNRETWGEYVQWLAEKVIEREKTKGAIPAFIEYKDWEPE